MKLLEDTNAKGIEIQSKKKWMARGSNHMIRSWQVPLKTNGFSLFFEEYLILKNMSLKNIKFF